MSETPVEPESSGESTVEPSAAPPARSRRRRALLATGAVLVVVAIVAAVAAFASRSPESVADVATDSSASLDTDTSGTLAPGTSDSAVETTVPETTVPETTTTLPPPPPPPADAADPNAPGVLYEYPDRDMADPAIFWDVNIGLYRLYTTNQSRDNGNTVVNVPMWTSPNLRDWTLVGDVMPTMPAWATRGFSWAPEVHLFGNTWVLMVSVADTASGHECIAYATAPSPDGPFVPDDTGPLVCPLDRNGAIDPYVFVDADGSKWLLWKSEENAKPSKGKTHIWSQRLDRTGHLTGPVSQLLEADQEWQYGLIESPAMIRDAFGRYWLFVSGGPGNNDGYAIAVVGCVGPKGPCWPADENSKIIRTNSQGQGPGEQGLFIDTKGNTWVAYSPNSPFQRGGIRPLALAHLKWDAFGRPYIATPPASFWR